MNQATTAFRGAFLYATCTRWSQGPCGLPFSSWEITLIQKVGKSGHLFHVALSPIISLQLASIIPAQNCRDFRFHAGLALLYLSSSLSRNILLSQPLSHHRDTLSCASWHRIAKGSSYRFIPPSCDLSSMRFGPGRIQKPVRLDRQPEQGQFPWEKCTQKKKDSWPSPWPNLQTALLPAREAGTN